ncbi:MAG: 4Fe-4S dicluster domain-containing protein [Desulfobacterales bacterium]|nr:4Fe-4S dicluster domain-containing protein [Desulfobacterales bacterium]
MISVKINKGYDLHISGKPSLKLDTLENPTHVAAIPELIPFIKPKLQVDVGDPVKIGSVLFVDKKRPELKFLSPGCGKVVEIKYGHRRIIQEIVIKLSNKEKKETFTSLCETELGKTSNEKLAQILMDGGVWPFIRTLPFRDIASPDSLPHSIWVSLYGKDPFQPDPQLYLQNQNSLFTLGLNILKKFSSNVHVIAPADNSYLFENHKKFISHAYSGNYPSDEPGVMLYHTKKSSSENYAWYINGQDLLLLAQMLTTGTYPIDRIVAVSDLSAGASRHVQTRMGVNLAYLLPSVSGNGNMRYITGGIFKGHITPKESYLGLYETSLNIVPASTEKDFLGFLRPGFERQSHSRLFLSVLNTSDMKINSGMHGEERSCINCGTCTQVCAVDILPQFMYKSLLADEIEDALSHGLLDCVECGLCTYVCPSKIELCTTFIKERRAYYQEQLLE